MSNVRQFVVCTKCPDGWHYPDRLPKKKGLCKCGTALPEGDIAWAKAKLAKRKAKANAGGTCGASGDGSVREVRLAITDSAEKTKCGDFS